MSKLRIVNIGISSFYDALCAQECEAVQIDWHPPVKISEEMARMLDITMEGALAEKIDAANEAAVNAFLDQRIKKITELQDIVCRVTEELSGFAKKNSLADVLEADATAKERVLTLI